jgi:CheY-like chemotaxis protein
MTVAEILLVEDNAGDVVLMRRALEQCPIAISMRVARDGDQALRVLADPAFHPQLIILDLHMPRVTGHAVLERYANLEHYANRDVPVVVFSSSRNDVEMQRTLLLGAREYVHKPVALQEFSGAVQGIVDRWLVGAKHPTIH